MAEAKFQKHTFGKTKKREYALLDDFDPRPTQYRGTAKEDVTKMRNGTVNGTIHGMGKLQGKALFYQCSLVSLVFYRYKR